MCISPIRLDVEAVFVAEKTQLSDWPSVCLSRRHTICHRLHLSLSVGQNRTDVLFPPSLCSDGIMSPAGLLTTDLGTVLFWRVHFFVDSSQSGHFFNRFYMDARMLIFVCLCVSTCQLSIAVREREREITALPAFLRQQNGGILSRITGMEWRLCVSGSVDGTTDV